MLGLGAVPALIQLTGMLFVVPESPRWLLTRAHKAESMREENAAKAVAVLQRIRGEEANVESEIREIEESIQLESRGGWRELLSPAVRPALLVGVALQVRVLLFRTLISNEQFFQQFCGINTAMYYSPKILKKAGFEDDAVAIWYVPLPPPPSLVADGILSETLGLQIS